MWTWGYVDIPCGLGSVVSIVACYRLDSPGIKSRWGRDFPNPTWPALEPTQHSVKWIPGLVLGLKLLEHGIDHPPPSSLEVEERVELYQYSLLAYSRVNFTFTFYLFLWIFPRVWHWVILPVCEAPLSSGCSLLGSAVWTNKLMFSFPFPGARLLV
jgi:hypothetical protein